MNKTIMITGTSSGIGRATAVHFQKEGWNVIATMRRPEEEKELTELDNVLVTRLDVLDSASITSAVAAGMERFGSIDALVNNAGYGTLGILETFDMAGIERQFGTNVLGLIETTKAVIPHMRKQASGVILNISSVGGKVAYPLGSLYHGTKFAVEGFSEGLYYEMGALGIRVKVVEPGAIATEFSGRSFDFRNDPALEEYQPMVGKLMEAFGSVMTEASTPEYVAEVIYGAVTDDKDQLRYIAGMDAEATIGGRAAMDDASFMAAIKQEVNL